MRFKVAVNDARGLGRQGVTSDQATVTVPEIDLEIPANSQKGAVTTVEGVLQRTVTALEQDQPVRRALDPDGAQQIDAFVDKVKGLMTAEQAFHIVSRVLIDHFYQLWMVV